MRFLLIYLKTRKRIEGILPTTLVQKKGVLWCELPQYFYLSNGMLERNNKVTHIYTYPYIYQSNSTYVHLKYMLENRREFI